MDFKKLSFSFIAVLTILVLLSIYFFEHMILLIVLFIVDFVFMLRIGQFSILDIDPLPFFSLLVLEIYGLAPALLFTLFSLPIVDVLVARISQFSFINIVALSASIVLAAILPLPLLLIGPILFNALRVAIGTTLGLGLDFLIFSSIHAAIYFVLGSLLTLVI